MSGAEFIEKLRREHALDSFDCGKDDLNRFLKRQAWNNQQAHAAQTYVLAKDLAVLGYYSLAAGSIGHDEATERIRTPYFGWRRRPIQSAPRRYSYTPRMRMQKAFTSISTLNRARAIHTICCCS